MSTAQNAHFSASLASSPCDTLVSSFAEWLHAIVYGSPGEPSGSCQVSSGQWCQPEPGHRGETLSVLMSSCVQKAFCKPRAKNFLTRISMTVVCFNMVTLS